MFKLDFMRFSLSNINLYFEERNYKLKSNVKLAINHIWKKYIQENPKTANNRFLNTIKTTVEGNIILGTTDFKDYICSRLLLNNRDICAKFNVIECDLENIQNIIDPMSSFPAIIMEKHFVMGKKIKWGIPFGRNLHSFPGAGFLDFCKDSKKVDNQIKLNTIKSVINREIREELGIDISNSKTEVIGVGKELMPESYSNSAIFSITYNDLSMQNISRNFSKAVDRWEFQQDLIFVPINDMNILSAVINSIFKGKIDITLTKEIQGIEPNEIITPTPKALLMLFEIGRHLYGKTWYKNEVKKYPHYIQIQTR